MNTKFSVSWFVLLSLSLAGVANSVTPVRAEMDGVVPPQSEAPATAAVASATVEHLSNAVAASQNQMNAQNLSPHSIDRGRRSSLEALQHSPDSQRAEAIAVNTLVEPMPDPGSTSTSAKLLLPSEQQVAQSFDPNNTTPPPPLTETEIRPGSATRTSYSFIGFGANIGISGSKNSLTRDVSFAVFSKIGLNPDISVRPTLLIRDDVYITLPVTFDFSPYVLEGGYRLGPYFGGGLAISTGSSSYVRPLLTAGLDVPLGPQFTGTAGFNFAFFDSVDVGFILGIGYNFRGF